MKKLLLVGSFFGVLVCGQSVQIKVANAASYQGQAGIALRSLVTIAGQNLSNVTMVAPDPGRLPMSLGGVSVAVNDIPCPILSVSPTQISAYLDSAIQTGQVELAVTTPVSFALTRIMVEPNSSPGAFTWSGTGSGNGAIIHRVTLSRESFSVTERGAPTRLSLFANGLDSNAGTVVRVGGIPVPVESVSDHPQFQGMQQVDLRLAPALAGAGRLEVVVEQRGRPSNVTEMVVLPEQGVFPSDRPNQTRSRELAAIAWIPNTGLALVADENDDVLRVVDLTLKRVTRVIALPDGAQPTAIGVWETGPIALVALRGRDSIAVLDLNTWSVAAELAVGRAPSAIAVSLDQAVIVCSDSDAVHFFDFRLRELRGSASTGRLPKGVSADRQRIYVTNQSDGTITALDWTTRSAVSTLKLGVDARPGAIQVLPEEGLAVAAEPSAGPEGKLWFVNLGTGASVTHSGNPERSGGASQILRVGDTLFMANQTGSSVTALETALTTTTSSLLNVRSLRTEAGTRALAYNARDKLLLALNQGSGSISLIDPASFTGVGRIDAVRVTPNDDNDHTDRLTARNLPTFTELFPANVRSDSSFLIQLLGTNLTGATAMLFIDPQDAPALERGRGHWNRGTMGQTAPGITITDLRVGGGGTVVTAQVRVARGHGTTQRLIRVLTPNGETSLAGAPVLSIVQ